VALQRPQAWQLVLIGVVVGYLALGVATHSLKAYHWLIAAVLPLAFVSNGRVRRFFTDWWPLFAFWLTYDRLRLLQPLLFSRVAVEAPYLLERWLFGWLAGGDVPPHSARLWLASLGDTAAGVTVGWSAQLIYLSYLLILPVHLFIWWLRGNSDPTDRGRFHRHIVAFTALHVMAMATYVALPVAPPWWVSLHGMVQPTVDLVARTNMADAMYGVIVQRMIKNAAQWFGAVPSLHAAYPVLLWFLALRDRGRPITIVLGVYSALMFVVTVVLNQHYIIDLVAAVILAAIAWRFALRITPHLRSS
jgi:membrane-associated phospholipid phosphatase